MNAVSSELSRVPSGAPADAAAATALSAQAMAIESNSQPLGGVRRDLAPGYLQNLRFEVGQVAALLGYACHGSFTRWCGQSFGESSARWRKGRRS